MIAVSKGKLLQLENELATLTQLAQAEKYAQLSQIPPLSGAVLLSAASAVLPSATASNRPSSVDVAPNPAP